MPTDTLPDTREISKGDRMELRRIVKGRIEHLHEQINVREGQIKRQIVTELEHQAKDLIMEVTKESTTLLRELDSLFNKIDRLTVKMERAGIVARDSGQLSDYERNQILDHLRDWRVSTNEKADTLVEKVKDERGIATLNLRGIELELLEKLSTDALQSKEARAFLTEIPEIDSLLPLPNGDGMIKQLVKKS